jgi:putative restriction endonuclease
VCGFDLRIGLTPAGLEAAHIQWHHVGGPDIESNGLSLCALHHKLFDLGAFTVEPSEHRVVFSQHAISGGRGMAGELQFHGRAIHAPQHGDLLPAPEFLAWNVRNVFKAPARQASAATPRATR